MDVRVVPTKVHGAIDYGMAPALALAPELFRMKDGKSASLPPRIAGVTGAVAAALSDQELAAKRVVPMKAHLVLDAVTGVAVAVAPWVGGSARKGARHWLPHALVGAEELALALTTRTRSESSRASRLSARNAALGVGAVTAAAAVGAGAWYALRRFRGRSGRPETETGDA
jgi:hypothetical protein